MREGEFVLVRELVPLDEAVPAAEDEPVPVVELQGVPVREDEAVPESELVLVALALLDEDGVGAGVVLRVAWRRLAMLRPRKVMDDTAASASPASHSVDS